MAAKKAGKDRHDATNTRILADPEEGPAPEKKPCRENAAMHYKAKAKNKAKAGRSPACGQKNIFNNPKKH